MMLAVAWVLSAFVISLVQLLVLTQPEWIVNDTLVQGLFALCSRHTCELRLQFGTLVALASQALGVLVLLFTAAVAPAALFCSRDARPLHFIANAQMVAALLFGATALWVPFDLTDVRCDALQLWKSTSCRIGWAYAVACVCSLLSLACPVLGRVLADQRKQYTLLPAGRLEFFL